MLNKMEQWGKRYHFDNIYDPMLALSKVKLLQAGEIIVGNGFVIESHVQSCAEISYVVSGCCDFYTDDAVFHAGQGDIHVIEEGKAHKIVVGENDNLRMAYIGFQFRKDIDGIEELKAFYKAEHPKLQTDKYFSRTLFEQLLYEIYAAQSYSVEAMDACINQLLIHVFRIFQHGGEGERRRIVEEARMDRIIGHTVFKTLRYIDGHLGSIDNISRVAEALGYNSSYLSRVFHEKTGLTISQYITDRKIEKGKTLLKEGMNVGAVAQHLGYASSQSFCKAFDRREGCSPTEYLKNQKIGQEMIAD